MSKQNEMKDRRECAEAKPREGLTVAKKTVKAPATKAAGNGAPATDDAPAREVLVADIIIDNAPDPVFVSDLEGKILQANDAVSQLLGFRQDEVRRAVALALHQRGGDPRVHGRAEGGRRARRHAQRGAQPALGARAR